MKLIAVIAAMATTGAVELKRHHDKEYTFVYTPVTSLVQMKAADATIDWQYLLDDPHHHPVYTDDFDPAERKLDTAAAGMHDGFRAMNEIKRLEAKIAAGYPLDSLHALSDERSLDVQTLRELKLGMGLDPDAPATADIDNFDIEGAVSEAVGSE